MEHTAKRMSRSRLGSLTHFNRAVFQGRAIMRAGRALTVLAAAAVSVTAGPARASTTGNTATTFSVTGGAFAITVPPSTVNLGSASPGAQITAQLGTVQVTDARALLTAAWTSSVTSTASWNPTLGISVPAAAVAGTYTGTVTHSVA
jgi:hypothetical protein